MHRASHSWRMRECRVRHSSTHTMLIRERDGHEVRAHEKSRCDILKSRFLAPPFRGALVVSARGPGNRVTSIKKRGHETGIRALVGLSADWVVGSLLFELRHCSRLS